jgi:site-specific DNA recombinase
VVQAAAVYARISSDPEGNRLGVDRQTADCRALAERKGWPIAEVYIDDDRSAYSGKPRPEYRRMLADISAGAVDAVLVYNLDRLHRQPRELESFFDVVDAAGLTALASVEGDINLASHDGRFHARILGAVARKSSDDLSRRIRRKNEERALAGLPTGGGHRPFGYQADRRTLDPVEAPLVQEAAARVLAGEAVRAIAAEWDKRGLKTPAGKGWTVQTLRRLLVAPRLSAQREYRGEIVAAGQWQPIVTPDETARLRVVLAERSRSRTRPVRRYLLAGLLRCGLCDAVLVARPQADRQRRYVCATGPGKTGCGRLAVKADDVEALISGAVLERLASPRLAAARAGGAASHGPMAEDERALAADQGQLDELARVYGERAITLSEWLAARKPIEARIAAARRRLSKVSRRDAIADYLGGEKDARAEWPALTLNRQRSVVSAMLDRAVVGPAVRGRSTFDPGRVRAVWRDD